MTVYFKQPPHTLYFFSLFASLPVLRRLEEDYNYYSCTNKWLLDHIPSQILYDLMEAAFVRFYVSNIGPLRRILHGAVTNPLNNRLLFAPRLKRALIFANSEDYPLLAARCTKLHDVTLVNANNVFYSDVATLFDCTLVVKMYHMCRIYEIMLHDLELRRYLYSKIVYRSGARSWFQVPHPELRCSIPVPVSSFSLHPRRVQLYLSVLVGITIQDVLRILENFPGVRMLQYDYLLPALHYLYERRQHEEIFFDLRSLNIRFFNLQQDGLFSDSSVAAHSISAAVEMCPRLASVSVDFGFTDMPSPEEIFRPLSTLKHLEEVSLTMWDPYADDIKVELYSFLQKRGVKLKILQLTCLSGFDLEAVLAFCPNLLQLRFHMNQNLLFETVESARMQKLSQLRVLNVRNIHDRIDPIPNYIWRHLLSCETLRVVDLYCVKLPHETLDIVTDRFWQHLTFFSIERCMQFLLSHAFSLVHFAKKLSVLRIYRCFQFRNIDRDMMVNYLLHNDVDIEFEYVNPLLRIF